MHRGDTIVGGERGRTPGARHRHVRAHLGQVHDAQDRRARFRLQGGRLFSRPAGPRAFHHRARDPRDASHIISFSGEKGSREQDNIYELEVDRMLLNSKDRPKVDGLPVPLIESSTGTCRQSGIISTRQISSISCTATAKDGKKYELQFVSDGEPVMLRRIRQSTLEEEKARAKKAEQFECRRKAYVAKILPRDWTAYVIRCLADDDQKAAQ